MRLSTTIGLLGLLLGLSAPAFAQAPLVPGNVIAFDIDPGQTRSGTTTVPRPDANLAFEYRIDGAATTIAAVKASPCVATTPAPTLTCRLAPPSLTPGPHTIEIRGIASPAETGVAAGAFASPFAVTLILVTAPGAPINTRLATLP